MLCPPPSLAHYCNRFDPLAPLAFVTYCCPEHFSAIMNRCFAMPLRHAVGIGALLVAVLFSSPEALGKPAEVPNFNLPDLGGRNHALRRAEGKAVVLFFTGTQREGPLYS